MLYDEKEDAITVIDLKQYSSKNEYILKQFSPIPGLTRKIKQNYMLIIYSWAIIKEFLSQETNI